MMWLEGHALTQTICTCLYIYRPSTLDDSYLAPIVFSLLKRCAVAKEVIIPSDVYQVCFPFLLFLNFF